MIEVLVLPERERLKINRDQVSVAEILELLDIRDLENVAILINDRLSVDQRQVVRSGDRVVLIRQATGGA